jgi:Lar family restriction alleviation protein
MKLKPCPFCRCKDVAIVIRISDFVECNKCFMRGPIAHNETAAIKKWNRRVKG